MNVLECSSKAGLMEELVSLARGINAPILFLENVAGKTIKELEFAHFLAEQAFETKTNISPEISKEILLFLSCESNFSSAVKKNGAKSSKGFILVAFGDAGEKQLAKTLLLDRIKPISLPEWGKKKGKYFEAELAVERMALARVRN